MNTAAVLQLSPITAEVRERITQAANTLFAQAGHQTLPTVDQVRRLARTDMNATSAVMRDWRREQATRAAPAPVQLPDTLAQAHAQAVAALWTHAQQLAGDSLLVAQAGWDAERAEIGAIQQQVSGAYDALAAEFEQVKAQAAAAAQAHEAASAQAAAELALAIARAERAEGRLDEAERRRDSLAAENDRLAADAARLQAQADQAARDLAKANDAVLQAAERHNEERKQTAAETHHVVERMNRAETERDDSRRDAAKAREVAARLQGQVEALKDQFAALLRTLGQGGDGGEGGLGQGVSPRRAGP